MASGFGKQAIQNAINWLAGKTPAATSAGVWWVALFVGDPGDDGQSGAEATGTGYARVSVVAADWDPATDATPSVLQNANPVAFPTAGGDWSTASNQTHFALFSHATNATESFFVGRGVLTTAAPVLSGQTPNFPIAALRMRGTETA